MKIGGSQKMGGTMRFKMFSYLPLGKFHRDGAPLASEIFTGLVSGANSQAGIMGDLDGDNIAAQREYAELRAMYFVWRNQLAEYDYVGFEQAQMPFFIDPLPLKRLTAKFPMIAGVREIQQRDWRVPVMNVSQPVFENYQDMRTSFTSEDCDRVVNWIARADVIVPPVSALDPSSPRQAYHTKTWMKFTGTAMGHGVFRKMPEAVLRGHGAWPFYNSFIMRADLFGRFMESAFGAITAFEKQTKDKSLVQPRFLMEHLLGCYLKYLSLFDPTVRVSELPLLNLVPVELPVGFDGNAYAFLNPDIANRGLDPAAHYLVYGWQQNREWML
jgi:hypothetical protein